MKKLVIIIAAVLVLVFAILLALPFVFKTKLVEAVKTSVNQKINATVGFSEPKISLFRDFPKATIVLENVFVTGKGEFQGDTLFNAASLNASMNLFSLLKSSGREIGKIVIDSPKLNLLVNDANKANWDITFPEIDGPATLEKVTAEPEKPFEIKLEKIEIRNGQLLYHDESATVNLALESINLDLTGKMYGAETALNVVGKAGNFRFEYDSVQYISNVALETKTLLAVNYESMKIAIRENELFVNRLPLQISGTIEMPADSQIYDLQFETKTGAFENFLALVPGQYSGYLENLKTSGSASVSGSFKGLWLNEIYPGISIRVQVENGAVQYKDFPEKIEKISGLIAVEKPQGELDLMVLKIADAHAEVKNNPVDFNLALSQMFTNPSFSGSLNGKVDFGDLKKALQTDSLNISGGIEADLDFSGNVNDVEAGNYEKVKAAGTLKMNNFVYRSSALSQEVNILSGILEFSPVAVNLKQLDLKVGESDFSLIGQVKDYLGYVFGKGLLKGDLQLQSDFINVKQLMALQKAKPEKGVKTVSKPVQTDSISAPASKQSLAFDVPSNLSFTFRSAIKRAVFDKLEMNSIAGNIVVNDGKLTLNGLTMNTLGGDVKVTGSYKNTPQKQPLFDFTFDIRGFDIPATFNTLSGIRQLAPIASDCEGKISTSLKMNGQLKPDLSIIPASVDAVAMLSTFNVVVKESPVFSQLKNIINPELLKNVTISDFKANIDVNKGNIDLKPFKTKVAGQETTLSGSLNTEQLLNLKMDFVINRDAFGQDIKNILSAIPGNNKIQQLPAGVVLNGPVGNPSVKLDLTETKDVVANAAKGEIQNSLNKLGKGLKNLLGK